MLSTESLITILNSTDDSERRVFETSHVFTEHHSSSLSMRELVSRLQEHLIRSKVILEPINVPSDTRDPFQAISVMFEDCVFTGVTLFNTPRGRENPDGQLSIIWDLPFSDCPKHPISFKFRLARNHPPGAEISEEHNRPSQAIDTTQAGEAEWRIKTMNLKADPTALPEDSMSIASDMIELTVLQKDDNGHARLTGSEIPLGRYEVQVENASTGDARMMDISIFAQPVVVAEQDLMNRMAAKVMTARAFHILSLGSED